LTSLVWEHLAVTWLADKILELLGWKFTGSVPDLPKMIIIGAPHTTNWDFLVYLGALHHYRLDASYIGKHTLFRWPLGWLFRRLGGIPVDRTKPGGQVRQVVDALESSDRMILVIAPEGTRSAAPHWKSGFLHIAAEAGVPILLAYIDFPSRRAGMGPLVDFDGDIAGFMDRCREFYAGKRGLHRDNEGPVAVREELEEG
jgi:1-acyl-sn-glycerol-3-phosphate acyltransferase